MRHMLASILVGATVLVTNACGDSPTSPSSDSRFVLRLSASAYGLTPAVLVTFSRVRVLSSSGTARDVPLLGGATQFTCDLQRLQANDGEIAVGALAPATTGRCVCRFRAPPCISTTPRTPPVPRTSGFPAAARFRCPSPRARFR